VRIFVICYSGSTFFNCEKITEGDAVYIALVRKLIGKPEGKRPLWTP
jgi:hypothetical protein